MIFPKLFANDRNSSLSVILLSLFGLLFLAVIWTNSDTILSRMGFQTKTSMAAEISRLQSQISVFEKANEDNQRELDRYVLLAQEREKAIRELTQERERLEKDLAKRRADYRESTKPSLTKVKDTAVETETTVTYDKAATQDVAEKTIVSLHDSYDALFGQGPPESSPEPIPQPTIKAVT